MKFYFFKIKYKFIYELIWRHMETGKKMCILKRVPTTTTVGELKKLFEKEYPSFYPERQAFFLDKTKPGLLFDQKSLQLAGKKGQ